ncbi:hypothetical protein EVAR_21349_1 [Eumeta japonica]|uniref:Uncharacterized protein n=1 Tax=Eumeta variegata TaxID=151549 RepID=A0A4C1YDG8_EUMVA|nr:hypothetical protein EVAR_21349_1 [Eumeta japonica]
MVRDEDKVLGMFIKLEQYFKTVALARDVLARHEHSAGGSSSGSDRSSSTAYDHRGASSSAPDNNVMLCAAPQS